MPTPCDESMNLHVKDISALVSPGAHAVLILDRAGGHGSGGLVVPDNTSLLHLPPYSPELNPVENVWQYIPGGTSSPIALRRCLERADGMLMC